MQASSYNIKGVAIARVEKVWSVRMDTSGTKLKVSKKIRQSEIKPSLIFSFFTLLTYFDPGEPQDPTM